MAYSVQYRVDLNVVPETSRDEIRRMMDEIADVVSTVPASNPFWTSSRNSLLQIDVSGWRLVYRVEPRNREILVVELAPIVS